MTAARTMVAEPQGWVGRLAAWGLLAALVVLVYAGVVAPLAGSYEALDTERARTERLLSGFQRVAQKSDGYDALLQQVLDRQASSGVYLLGETESLAAAELQERVSAEVKRNRVLVRSLQVLSAQDDGGFRRLAVRVQFSATIEQFQKILHGLEATRPLLFLDNLEITARAAPKRPGLPAREPQLSVRMDLAGYLRPEV